MALWMRRFKRSLLKILPILGMVYAWLGSLFNFYLYFFLRTAGHAVDAPKLYVEKEKSPARPKAAKPVASPSQALVSSLCHFPFWYIISLTLVISERHSGEPKSLSQHLRQQEPSPMMSDFKKEAMGYFESRCKTFNPWLYLHISIVN